jgi:hypothetical protein
VVLLLLMGQPELPVVVLVLEGLLMKVACG